MPAGDDAVDVAKGGGTEERNGNGDLSSPPAPNVWTSRHADVLEGVEEQHESLARWVRDFLGRVPGTPKGAFLLGPPGTGKTRVALLALRAAGLRVLERNASSQRTRRALEDDIMHAVRAALPVAVLVEDVDAVVAGQGGLEFLCRLVNPLRGTGTPITAADRLRAASAFGVPIVFVANSCATRALQDLMSDSLCLSFGPVAPASMRRVARRILAVEDPSGRGGCLAAGDAPLDETVAALAERARGDARAFVTSLECAFRFGAALASSSRDPSPAPADVARRCFEGPPLGAPALFRLCSAEPVSVSHVVHENYVARLPPPAVGAVSALADRLADCDVLLARDPTLSVYVPGLSSYAAEVLLPASEAPRELAPGTSWSRHSYEGMRAKQLQRARDALAATHLRDHEHVAHLASMLRALAGAARYDELRAYASAYGLDHRGVDTVVRATSAEPLKQRHKTHIRRLLPASSPSSA